MNTTMYLAIKEVDKLLGGLPKKARKKIKCSVSAPSLYKKALARDGYTKAPVVPCHCAAESRKYGIAIQCSGETPDRTMFFCPTCLNITSQPFSSHKFIKEGIDEHNSTIPKKANEPVLG